MNPLDRIEELLHQIDSAADPNVRSAARELVQALMDFHGAGVARMLELIEAAGPGAAPVVGSFGRDEIVAPLLLLYDLHPEPTETRVRRAVNGIRNLQLIGVEDFEVRLQVTGHGHASPSRELIEKAVLNAAPEVQAIHIEGLATPGFVPLEKLLAV